MFVSFFLLCFLRWPEVAGSMHADEVATGSRLLTAMLHMFKRQTQGLLTAGLFSHRSSVEELLLKVLTSILYKHDTSSSRAVALEQFKG